MTTGDSRAGRIPLVEADVQRAGTHDNAGLVRNLGWTVVATAVSLIFVLGVVGVLYNGVVDGSWWGLIAIPVDGLLTYWIAGGAWKRTTWGTPTPR